MNTLEKNIYNLIEETAEQNGLFLIDLVIRGNQKKRIIEVYVDGEKNVTADDCASLSRQIDSKLEILPEMNPDYRLDVSSPGIDRPLKYLKQFPKNINRKFEISYSAETGTKKITGTLNSVEGDDLTFTVNNNPVIVNFNKIKKAKVIISFS